MVDVTLPGMGHGKVGEQEFFFPILIILLQLMNN
jgi:hypothetical protein